MIYQAETRRCPECKELLDSMRHSLLDCRKRYPYRAEEAVPGPPNLEILNALYQLKSK